MPVPVSSLEGTTLKPAARPVQREYSGAVAKDNGGVAEALAALSPTLAASIAKIDEAVTSSKRAKGRVFEERSQDPNSPEAKAVRDGTIPGSQSKSFMEGYNQMRAKRLGLKYNTDYAAFAARTQDSYSTPEEFAQASAEFDTEWKKNNLSEKDIADDTFFHDFSSRTIEGKYNTGYGMALHLENKTRQEAEQTLQGTVAELAYTYSLDTAPDSKALFDEQVQGVREWAYNMGMTGGVVNELVYGAIADVSKQLGDPRPAEWALEHTINGTPLPPSVTDTLRTAAIQASSNGRSANRVKRQEQDARMQDIELRMGSAFAASSDPYQVDVSGFIKEVTEVDPTKIDMIRSLQDRYAVALSLVTPKVQSYEIDNRLSRNPAQASITLSRMLTNGQITQGQYNKFRPYAASLVSSTKGGTRSKSAWYGGYKQRIKDTLSGYGSIMSGNVATAYAVAAEEYLNNNPDVSEVDARKYLSALAEEYQKDPQKYFEGRMKALGRTADGEIAAPTP